MGRYEVNREGDRICFKVRPTSAPFPLGCGLACVAIFVLLLMVTTFTSDNKEAFVVALFMFAVFLGLPLLVLLFLWKGPKANAYRKETSFEVTPTGIAIYGGEITRGRIHRLILRNHVSGAEHIYVESTVFWGGGLATAAPALGADVGRLARSLARMHRSALARQSWRARPQAVVFEYSRRAFHSMQGMVLDGCRKKRKHEVAGVLYGTREGNIVRVQVVRRIACEHAQGWTLLLSTNDKAALKEQLTREAAEPALQGLAVVGWFLSHTAPIRTAMTASGRTVLSFAEIRQCPA
jgi:hypothetical protein